MFVKFWKQMQQEQSKELNSKDERWENAVDLPEVATGDDNSSAAVLRFISAWLNNDVKRKRGYRKSTFLKLYFVSLKGKQKYLMCWGKK